MDPTDEKIRDIYQALERQEARLILKIEKSEERSALTTTDKLNSLKDLVNQNTTARHETISNELIRIQKNNFDCSGKCASTVRGFHERLVVLEKIGDSVEDHIELAPGVQNRLEILERSKIGADNYLDVGPAQIRILNEKMAEMEKWRAVNWQRTIIYAAVAIVAALKVLEWLNKAIPVAGMQQP